MDNIIIYNTDDGKTNVKLYANDGTVWLPRPDIAELFQCTRANVALHIKNIYKEGELDESATCKDFLQVQIEDLPVKIIGVVTEIRRRLIV